MKIKLIMFASLLIILNTAGLCLGNELHIAILDDDANQVRECIFDKMDLNAKNSLGRTPLSAAVYYDLPDIACMLIAAGADVHATNNERKTALHEAIFEENPRVIDALLAAGANVNAKDNDGRTALHEAVAEKRRQLIRVLIAAGADVMAADNDGVTSLDEAKRKYIRKIIFEAAAKQNALCQAKRWLLSWVWGEYDIK